MQLNLSKKVAVILGGSAGVGYEIASKLASEGCKIAICARDIQRLRASAESISSKYKVPVFHKSVDLAVDSELKLFFQEVFNKYKSIDILINNTGGPKPSNLIDLSDDDYHDAYNLILMSKVRSAKMVLPHMLEKNDGKIIHIESTSIKSVMPGMGLSNIFRSASNAYIKTLAAETVRQGLNVHTIMLGPFLTDRLKELGELSARKSGINFEAWKKNAADATPLGRFGVPSEVGPLVAFLVSDEASYMNGLCIAIDGGILQTIN